MDFSLQCVPLFPLRYPCLSCFPCPSISPPYLTVSSSQIWQSSVLYRYVPQFNHTCILVYFPHATVLAMTNLQIFHNRLRWCSLSIFNFLYDFTHRSLGCSNFMDGVEKPVETQTLTQRQTQPTSQPFDQRALLLFAFQWTIACCSDSYVTFKACLGHNLFILKKLAI